MSKPPARACIQAARRINQLSFVISSILAGAAASGQQAAPAAGASVLEEVIVTAQKRAENLQNVPISLQALDTKRLEELQVTDFNSYAKYLPSLSFQTFGPGQSQIYVRGVTNGGDGLYVGSQPLVGVYLDEMPVTTIANNLDVHIYDVARVEALSGPQGTLFGASSMAGTLRIITNKPSAKGFEAGYDLTANKYTDGGPGGKVEGFVNLPISDRAAVRLVGFSEYDGGYINNVLGPPEVYPTSGLPRSNAGLTKRHYNTVKTNGGRGALKFDFNDNWTVTPAVIAQNQNAQGTFAFTPAAGDLNVSRYQPDENLDKWWMSTLTVEGKIADFDIVYAGGYMRRNIDNDYDYSDYSYSYDVYYHNVYANSAYATYFGDNFRNNAGQLISPQMETISKNRFTKLSHELRISSPAGDRLRGVAGLFYQRQSDDVLAQYRVAGLADIYSITNEPGVYYLNSQQRVDRDKAVFTDLAYDLTGKLTIDGGLRVFSFDNTVYGFFGYNGLPTYDGYVHSSGENQCAPGTIGTLGPELPCANIDSEARKSGSTYKLNLTYKFDPEKMIYTTWSTGFRPGGVNRVRTRPPYAPDYLTNFELGWKTEWFGKRVRFNGALFFERWKDAQFAITGENGITEIVNAGGSEIRGMEADVLWAVTDHFTLSGSGTALDAKLTSNACAYPSPSLSCTEPLVLSDGSTKDNSILAPNGTRLPVSSKFKGNLIARYEFTVKDLKAHVQGAVTAQSDAIPALQVSDAQTLGNQPAYASIDLAAGVERGSWHAEVTLQNAFDRRGELTRYANCAPSVCTLVNVVPIQPRLIGVTFGQKF